jgi:hypothetical protein
VLLPADPVSPFVGDMNAVFVFKIVAQAAIPFVRVFLMMLPQAICNLVISKLAPGMRILQPPIVGCSCHMSVSAKPVHRVVAAIHKFLDRTILN